MQKQSFWQFFLNNWRFTYILLIAFVLIGLISVVQIPKESNPDVTIPFLVVNTPFPGASAEDVEEFVVKPIEDQVLGLSEIKEVSSNSSRGFGSVFVEYEIGTDIDKALDDVKGRVDLAKFDLPEDAEDPITQKVSFSDEPILQIVVSGPFAVTELTDFAEEFKDEIERVNGVSSVELIGGQDREVRVLVDKASLDRYGLSLRAVTGAIRTANSNIPVGSIETAGELYTVRFDGRLESTGQVGLIPITAINNVPILVQDVASIENAFTEKTSLSELGKDGAQPESAVTLAIKKADGGNIINIVDQIWENIGEKQKGLPSEIQLIAIEDMAEFIKEDLGNLSRNGLSTIIIVMIILFIFLGWREAMLAGLALPTSFLITFAVLQQTGFTLNFLTLFSLILSLGIIVDAAIVITEAVNRQIREGVSAKEAAAEAIRQFSIPLFAGTFTTIFAFLPMMLSSGILGEFIKSIPVTVAIVLTASLFVALGIIPAVASRWLKASKDDHPLQTGKIKTRQRITDGMQNFYSDIIGSFIRKKSMRVGLTIILPLLFLASIALPITGVLKVEMFPEEDIDWFYVNAETPIGTPLDTTRELFDPVVQDLTADTRVESLVIKTTNNTARVVVLLPKDRKFKSYNLASEYTKKFEQITELKVTVTELSGGPPSSEPIEIKITGEELEIIDSIAYDIEAFLKEVPGTQNIETTIDETNGEFVFEIDRAKASIFGVTTAELAGTLRNAVYGSTAATITEEGEDVDVVVKYDLREAGETKQNKVDLAAIEGITVLTRKGEMPISTFVSTKYAGSRASIAHLDGERIARVTGSTKEGVLTQDVFIKFDEHLKTMVIPEGYTISSGGEREDIQQSFSDLFKAMFVGIFLIAALLVWQFNSIRQPFFILLSIPLALIAILPGLVLVGQPLSFPGMIGIVALAGIVVNNGIILVDRINTLREKGYLIEAAVEEAALSRLQPIILTTITTVAGVLPLAFTSETWGQLAYSIVFGLLFSTVLTLVVIPLLYLRFAERELEGEKPESCPYTPKISLLDTSEL